MKIVEGEAAGRVVQLLAEVFRGTLEAVGGLIGMSAPGKAPEELHRVEPGEFSKVEREEIAILDLPAEGKNPVHLAIGIPLDGAVALAGFLLMKAPEMIQKRLGAAALDETEQDAFGEVCNILAGSIEGVLRANLDPSLKLRHGTAPRYKKPAQDAFLSTAFFYGVGQVKLGELPPCWIYVAIDPASAKEVAAPDELPSFEVAGGDAAAGAAATARPRALCFGSTLPKSALDAIGADLDVVSCDHPDDLLTHVRNKPQPRVVLISVGGAQGNPRAAIGPVAENAAAVGIPVLAILERPTRSAVVQAVQAGARQVLAMAGAGEHLRQRIDLLSGERLKAAA